MATITSSGAVLKVVGSDIVNADHSLNRAGLKAVLFSDANPVGNLSGKVDFIICFVHQGPQPGTFAGVDHSLQPRPLRGIIYLPDGLATLTPAQLGGLLAGGVGHELGHYWLVPGVAKVRVGDTEVDTPTEQQIATALNQGLDYPAYPIIGRQDCHWSPFIDGDCTPMEAPNLGDPVKTSGIGPLGLCGRYDQVTGLEKVGGSFTLPDAGLIQTGGRFSTLERWLIGSYKPPAITSIGILWPSFLVLVPKWSFPFEFEAGLYVRLTSGATWYVGFHEGPHEVCAHEISSAAPAQVIPLPSDPLDPHVVVGARVVQRDSSLDLQVRLWAPRTLFLARPASGVGSPAASAFSFCRIRPNPTCDDVMGDVAQGAAGVPDAWTGWKTVASASGRVDWMGLSSRVVTPIRFHTLLSARLCLHQSGVTTPVPTLGLQQDFPAAGPALLPTGKLMMPYLLGDGTFPPSCFEEKPASRCAPKVGMAAPAGPFAFGGIIHLDRCVQVTWAGGLKPGKKMVGRAEYVALNCVVPPWTGADRAIRQGEPLDGAYKVLFCVAARDDTITGPMLTNLDLVRRGWEAYSPLLMDRRSDGRVF